MDTFVHDLRCAWRHFRQNTRLTAAAVLTLAVGIGATTAIFSVSDALLLRPLPYPDHERLVALRSTSPSRGLPDERTAPGTLADWQEQAASFEAIAGYRWRSIDLTSDGPSQRLDGLFVTPEFFEVFSVRELVGRSFVPEDRGSPTVVLGMEVWQDRFGADPRIVGSALDVNILNFSRVGPTPHTVLGVARVPTRFPPLTADFQLGVASVDDTIDFWTPSYVATGDARENRLNRELDVVGKLRAGVTIADAQTEMDAIASRLAEQYPASNRDWGVRVVPLRSQLLGDTSKTVLLLSLSAGIVLLIACANVANLLIAHGVVRQREVAIRTALGAGRMRIVRQFLIEAGLLALLAGALGVILSTWGISLIRPRLPAGVPLLQSVGFNPSVLGFAVITALLTAALSGLAPAMRISRADGVAMAGLQGNRLTASQNRSRVVRALIVAEVALTLMLLIGTGLLVRSAVQLLDVDPGFNPKNLLTMTVSLPKNKFDWNHNAVFYRGVLESVRSLPGVRGAAVIQGVPMRSGSFWTPFVVDGAEPRAAADLPVARIRVVSPGYFRVMGVPIVAGRGFGERDEVGEIGRPRFVIVGEGLAKRHWTGGDALGKRLQVNGVWMTVVGVAGDVRYAGLETNPDLELYYPQGLFPQAAITLLVRTYEDPLVSLASVRARIQQADQDAFVSDVRSMEELIADSQASRAASTLLTVMLGGIAVVLVLGGVYSVISQYTAQRRHELAIRVALGAGPMRLITGVLRHVVLPALTGVAFGIVGALATTRLTTSLLFGVSRVDLATWVGASVLVLACCLLAGFIPARRAAHVDPMTFLRAE